MRCRIRTVVQMASDPLSALQEGLPLCHRPFAALAESVGCTEEELIGLVESGRRQGIVRRFGAVFDVRRLGYRSALCASCVPPEECAAAAERIVPLSGVTHCYLREVPGGGSAGFPNLWFTLSYPSDVFAAMADEAAARLAPYGMNVLPATRRYKVDVVFGAATRTRDEAVDGDDMPITAHDRAVIGALQGDTEVRSDYFAAVAEKVGMKEWDLLSTLEVWRRRGRLKRIGLLLAHRNAGWSANGMCCWRVDGDTTVAGRALAERAEVTHCYERPLTPEFPYNLFAMIHARSQDEAMASYGDISKTVCGACGCEVPSTILISTVEYKKTSMTFFASQECCVS